MKKFLIIFIALLLPTIYVPSVFCENHEIAQNDVLIEKSKALLQDTNFIENVLNKDTTITKGSLNLEEVFYASPIIYSVLLIMSMTSFIIWLYTLLTLRKKDVLKKRVTEEIQHLLLSKNYEQAAHFCSSDKTLLAKMINSALLTKNHGPQFMLDSMKSEGKRLTAHYWHRISLLNDIVVIAPMLGLLGTVLGMFYAFYDINNTAESLSSLFDGLGIAVGTTVAGLIVAIIAMFFYTMLKHRLIRMLNLVESQAISLGKILQQEN